MNLLTKLSASQPLGNMLKVIYQYNNYNEVSTYQPTSYSRLPALPPTSPRLHLHTQPHTSTSQHTLHGVNPFENALWSHQPCPSTSRPHSLRDVNNHHQLATRLPLSLYHADLYLTIASTRRPISLFISN